jgi:imidazolonepropionase-like amidohydrolase
MPPTPLIAGPIGLVAVTLALGCSPSAALPRLTLTHVSVVDVVAGTIRPDQTVVIAGFRIEAVGKVGDIPVPRGSRVVDGSGKYLIPGLWDMHVHLTGDEPALRALVASGVTGARDMGGGGDFRELAGWRRRIATGDLTGPRLALAGPKLVGPQSPSDSGPWVIRTPAQGIRAVDSLIALGVDFVKVHENIRRPAFFAIAREARARHMPFVGHVPAGLTPAEVSDSGQRSIEHVEFIPDRCLGLFVPQGSVAAGCDGAALDSLIARLARNQTWLCPTIGSFRIFAPRQWPAIFAGFRGLVPLLRRHGIALLAGTDLGSAGIVPGASLQDELALLVEAGFQPAEVLRAATTNPARFLGLADSLGTVEPGMVADLVLLDGDPLADIHNTRRIAAVVRDGRLLERATLDSLLHASQADSTRRP